MKKRPHGKTASHFLALFASLKPGKPAQKGYGLSRLLAFDTISFTNSLTYI